MYKNVDVVTDAPAYFFWKELMEIFPAAKCIFHEREAEAWFVSLKNQMDKICERKKLPDALQRILIRILSPKMYKYTLMMEKNIAGHFFFETTGI